MRCSGLVGGAIEPLAVGLLGDVAGLRGGMLLTIVARAYIFVVGLVAGRLIANATASRTKAKATAEATNA